MQVASVSGGSIANAFTAQRCQLDRLGPGELDDTARQLATTIIRNGVLTTGWIALVLLAPVILGAVSGIVVRVLIVPWTWLAVVIGIGIALTGLIFRGLGVEWLLDRRYFRSADREGNRRHWNHTRFSSLSGRKADHVFCMTDLVLGLPIYASSQHGGIIWRRLKPERDNRGRMAFHTFDAGHLSIAALVRASAAFPGIPPRRLRIPPDPLIDEAAAAPRLAFLADGGLWNNLGSQVLREDGFIGSHAAWDGGVLRPYGPAPGNIPLLCFNGSGPLRPTQPWAFRIPGIALLNSLRQVTQVLNANTVLPRVDAMTQAFDRQNLIGMRPAAAGLVVDLRPTEDLAYAYRTGTWTPERIRRSDPTVKEWERNALERVRGARQNAATSPNTDWLRYVLGPPEPLGSFPASGIANIDDWDTLQRSTAWRQLVDKDEGTGPVDAPTTLGRIEPGLARRLIARGYLNTYLVSLFLAPLAEGELDRLAKFPTRLDKIVGIDR